MRGLILTSLVLIIFTACILPLDEAGNGLLTETSIFAESFQGNKSIAVTWNPQSQVNEYLLLRARDETTGLGSFELLYRGLETRFVDKMIESNVRYVYRVDTVIKGSIHKGESTGYGIGNNAEADLNEPNNKIEQAAALTSFKRATMYYYRFSCGHELSDTDWYKLTLSGGKSGYLQIREDGAVNMTSLLLSINGQEFISAEHGKWYELKNITATEKQIFIEVRANKNIYAEPGLPGGMIRAYTIIFSDTPDEDYKDPGDGGDDPDPDPKDPDEDKEIVIEETVEISEEEAIEVEAEVDYDYGQSM